MSVWERYSKEERDEYVRFLQVYGALSNLFRQKHGDPIPYLDSKFQETVYAKVFKGENVDIGNTPHDVLSVFGNDRIGIGVKTWMNSKPSYQKVMQLKRFKPEIDPYFEKSDEELAFKLSQIKNDRMISDYNRLGLSEYKNIYHYVTRDAGKFVVQETAYPLVDFNNLQNFKRTDTTFSWSDGEKDYKFTRGDSQIWQHFDSNKKDTLILNQFDVSIIDDPFDFLLKSYFHFIDTSDADKQKEDIVEIYLPLYSYRTKEVEEKSGLNSWNAAPKSKGSSTLRPLNEIYIPIPREFHKKFPDFFCPDIFEAERRQKDWKERKKTMLVTEEKPEVRFNLKLPNGKTIPGLVTQSNMKALQSGSNKEIDPETNKRYGQSALGQWLLVDVLGLKDRQVVTVDWLKMRGTDSVRLWRKKDDYSTIYIDFAPIGSFEAFMDGEENQYEE
ncbi:NgoFVII family restriction endonuclease [Streptococcus thermophilus]|uniref:restriction endonuclease PLD domain-containing protein n=1 Tax=Streptococcus thermophilus TaxID=1308 RepID=UPI000C220FB8|nr:restriction endonuclease PLD domain-containing protein [Streptococcus thermophilus]MBW7799690.1 NgoFVII family restriction endonuclease [Streptococcus thermophilus]MBW7817615.1 NgoFVII family restriction endonuclease [Streptococcus thermophilus]PJH78690.1 NgoFVII family restriction endonuclease [Streptococcus thermophilus]